MKLFSIGLAAIAIASNSYCSPMVSLGIEQGYRPSKEKTSGDTTFVTVGDFMAGINAEFQNRRSVFNWFSWTPKYSAGLDYQRTLPNIQGVDWLIARGDVGLCVSLDILRNKIGFYFGPNIGEAYYYKINEREGLFGPRFRNHFAAMVSAEYGVRVNFENSNISAGAITTHYFSKYKDNATNLVLKYGFPL